VEGGRRWWGGSGFHRRRWRHDVLLAGVSEGCEEAARKLLRVDVVLLVCLAGARRRCIGGSTVRPSGGEVRAHRRCGRRCLGAGK
jgi:hypothetical protein